MAIAKFHSVRGEKKTSALIMVKANPLEHGGKPAYVALAGVVHFAKTPADKLVQNQEFTIPDGYHFEDMANEDGEPITTESGAVLQRLAY